MPITKCHLFALSLTLAATEAAAQCPVHYFCATQNNSEPRGRTHCSDDGALEWDLPLGYVGVSYAGGYIRDSFVASGLPDGTPITIPMVIRAAGSIVLYWPRDFASADMDLFVNDVRVGGYAASIDQLPPVAGRLQRIYDEDVVVELPVIAGVPFLLMRGLHATIGGQMATYLRFENLPPGVRVTSCQGFASEGPVSTNRSTWGAVKAIYH